MTKTMSLPQAVLHALETLHNSGYEAYVVGGCVRDHLMGKIPHDYDICTSAMPCETIEVFSGYRTIETGLKHGTVTVLIGDTSLEITTFRTEGEYSDSRHPDAVDFVRSFREDAARRDFTMNSIGYSPHVGIADHYNGVQDIQNKLIRAVGDPETRFKEDALRILRALRFSAVTGFAIEQNTMLAIHKHSADIHNVSSERVFSELTKLICGDYAASVIDEYFDVITQVLPELAPMKDFQQHNPHHIYDVLHHTLKSLEAAPKDSILRWTILFHDVGKPSCFSMDENGIGHFYRHAHVSYEIAGNILRRLRASNNLIDRVSTLIRHHDTPIEINRTTIKKRMASLGEDVFFDLLQVMRADCRGLAPEYHYRLKEYDDIEYIAKEILAEAPCLTIRDLKISGNDLKQNGISPGPLMGRILNILLNEVLDEKTTNEREALIKRALEIERTL
ncbi:MAG: HD domain-containing protein [Clostridia bacterium]|nr:HD domain-containing protein [Clostridia bacterium]